MAAPLIVTSVLSLTNYCFSSFASVTSDLTVPGFPVSNVLKQDRSKKWRSYTYSGWFIIDMHVAQHPEVFGLIESNFGTDATFGVSAKITLTGADSIAMQGAVTWVWDYQINNSNRTWVKVIDLPTTGTWESTTKKRYWKVTIQLNKQDYFFQPELGVVWLGDMYQIPIDSNFSIKVTDSGKTTEAYNGTLYLDSLRPFADVSMTLPTIEDQTALILKSKLDTIGASKNILVDIYSPDSTTGRSLGTYYGLLDERSTATFTYKSNTIVDLKIKLTESLS